MGCTGCSVRNGKPNGCKSNGGCGTGGCNRLNTFDWLSNLGLPDTDPFPKVEVSFKNGARKAFFFLPAHIEAGTGDHVVVETGTGHDVGQISLSGELVRMQMKKKRISEDAKLQAVIRPANERDLERLQEARELEIPTMIRARVIARSLDLKMKIGDVEYQGDKRKATFYYTADGRVDFRELIRHYAREFKVKIEMRQIGARQESGRIGGLGSCGRELCCSTWLTDFKSVSTAAARYQNLSINQSKLSGQCGRLKCCLNYELDTYMEALGDFPRKADKLFTEVGKATLVKTDIFRKLMFYSYDSAAHRGKLHALNVEEVKKIQSLNAEGQKPSDLASYAQKVEVVEEEVDFDDDLTGVVELPNEKKKKRGGKRRKGKKEGKGPENKKESGSSNSKKPSNKKRSKSRSGRNKKQSDNKPKQK